jgi:hypothetical protein
VRLLAVIATVAAVTTGSALACPRHVRCIVSPPQSMPSPELPRASVPATLPDVRSVTLAKDDQLAFGDAPAKADPSEVEMPWIWRVLRDQVYTRMPRYDRPQRFTLLVSPVVVTSPSDTIPGVGVAGEF